MPRYEGCLVECSRCGKTHFLKYIGDGETDGGYTRWRKYEPLPEEWLNTIEIGYLCPICANEFRTFIKNFMGDDKKIASAWKLEGK